MTNRSMERRLAEIFEQARIDLGLSQADVSERAARLGFELTQTQVSRVLRCAVAMKVSDAEAIARALGMTLLGAVRLAEQQQQTAGSQVIGPGSDPAASDARRRRPRPVRGPRLEA